MHPTELSISKGGEYLRVGMLVRAVRRPVGRHVL